MTDQESLTKQPSQGSVHLTSSLIEQGLRNATLRSLIMSQYELFDPIWEHEYLKTES